MLNISLTTLRRCCDEYRGRPTLLAYGGQLPVFFAAMYSVPCPFQEATVALKVDEMWKKVYERRQDLMEEWIQCFRDGPVDAVDESKREIRKSLTEYGTNPRKNFLLMLMSCDPSLRGFRYFRQMCE